MSQSPGCTLDNAIRSALLRRAMRSQPPRDGWQRMVAQITGGCAGTSDRAPSTHPLGTVPLRSSIEYDCPQPKLL
ncbi:MAG: hypothetical protein R2844_11650 [Caldilineales bacterium]